MNRATVVATCLITAIVAFGAGYWVADRRTEAYVSALEFNALTSDIQAVLNLRNGAIENARSILYVSVDGHLNMLSQDDAQYLLPEVRASLSKQLRPLNAAWAADKPFEGEEFAGVRAMEEWQQMRARNDEFRLRLGKGK